MTDLHTSTPTAPVAVDEDRADALRATMVADLVERGALTPLWRPAVEQVPRHGFLPDTIWIHDGTLADRDLVPLNRSTDPAAWLTAAYGPDFVITQVDGGAPNADGRGAVVTSSASMPLVVVRMLAALEVAPGMRVCEIGTGTGWNAALLAHRVGAEQVVSTEIDPVLADAARVRLARAGYGAITVIPSGQTDAAAAHGPFDRLIATVAARRIPPQWLAQIRAGGVAIIPWGTDWYPSALVRLEVDADGRGRGRIVDDATFMLLRDQRVSRARLTAARRERTGATTTSTDLHPWCVSGDPHAATAIGIRLPGIVSYYVDSHPAGRLVIVERDGESCARLHTAAAPPYRVEQGGRRRLWDEVSAAYHWWDEHGRPDRDRWLITVGPDGQRIELESSPVRRRDPGADPVADTARVRPARRFHKLAHRYE